MHLSLQRPVPFRLFLHWCLLTAVACVLITISWDQGILANILTSDMTRISLVILLVHLAGTLYAGYRCWWLSRQIEWMFDPRPCVSSESIVQTFFHLFPKADPNADSDSDNTQTLTAEVMAERLRGNHQIGWFITGSVVKLGLLGTVVGFVLMLRSVSGIEQLDTSDIQELMQQMTLGMGVAMNTTLVGLVASLHLGIQFLMLDRAADRLVADAVQAAVSSPETGQS